MKFIVALLMAYNMSTSDAAVTNYITASTPVSGTAVADGSNVLNNLRDGDHATYFLSGSNSSGDNIQLDLGSSVSVETLVMNLPSSPSVNTRYDVYIGDTDFNGSYTSSNTKC